MRILAHGGGIDDMLLVLVPVVFIVIYRLFRGSRPPGDGPGADDERAPR